MGKKRRYRVNREILIKRAVWAAVLLLSAILLFSAYKLVRILKGYRQSEESYRALSDAAVAAVSPAPSAPPDTTDAPETPAPPEVPITVDWESLKEVNRDIVAWLYCDGTPINYPIVQTGDNEYYLTRGFDRKKNAAGALFLDCRNNSKAADENLIVYGHRMKDDSMLGTIPQYAEQSYYAEHPTMYLLTPARSYRVEVFACRTVHSEEKYFETAFKSADDFQRYLNKALEQSYWQPGFPVRANGPTLTLATCSAYANANDPRLLVHGLLVPVG